MWQQNAPRPYRVVAVDVNSRINVNLATEQMLTRLLEENRAPRRTLVWCSVFTSFLPAASAVPTISAESREAVACDDST